MPFGLVKYPTALCDTCTSPCHWPFNVQSLVKYHFPQRAGSNLFFPPLGSLYLSKCLVHVRCLNDIIESMKRHYLSWKLYVYKLEAILSTREKWITSWDHRTFAVHTIGKLVLFIGNCPQQCCYGSDVLFPLGVCVLEALSCMTLLRDYGTFLWEMIRS